MIDALTTLNWFAIALATLVYYLLGALWFTPLFGKAWETALGFHKRKGYRFGPMYYVAPLVSSLVVTMATAALVSALGIEHLREALLLGLVVGIGYAAAVSLTNAVTPNTARPLLLGAITGGYHVVGIVTVSGIIGALN